MGFEANDAARVAEVWRDFGEHQAGAKSPTYREIAVAMSEDERFCELLASRPARERQPNLVLSAVRFLGGDVSGAPGFASCLWDRLDEVLEVMATRRTQTNEVGRCAALLPILASLPQPLALLELGASAGLCLLPDRYSYDFGGSSSLGEGSPLITCEARGRSTAPSRSTGDRLASRDRPEPDRCDRPGATALARGARLARGDRSGGATANRARHRGCGPPAAARRRHPRAARAAGR